MFLIAVACSTDLRFGLAGWIILSFFAAVVTDIKTSPFTVFFRTREPLFAVVGARFVVRTVLILLVLLGWWF